MPSDAKWLGVVEVLRSESRGGEARVCVGQVFHTVIIEVPLG